MKKTFMLLAAAVACLIGFTSCDGEEIDLSQFAGQDVLGHITLVTSNVQGEQPYASGDSILLKSAMCNAQVEIINGVTVDAGAVYVGTASDIVAEGSTNINYPLCGINLRQAGTGTFTISCPVNNFSAFEYVRDQNWTGLLLSGSTQLGNVLVLAVDEENYYMAYEGTITITEFNEVGTLVKGQVTNVKAFYITKAQMTALWTMSEEERDAITPADYFTSTITLNGEISSRRANMDDVLDALEEI